MKVIYLLKTLIKEVFAAVNINHMLSVIPFCRTDMISNSYSSWIEAEVLSATSFSDLNSSGIIMVVIVLAVAGYFALKPPHQY